MAGISPESPPEMTRINKELMTTPGVTPGLRNIVSGEGSVGKTKELTVELFTWEKLDFIDPIKAAFKI